ncbi:MAG: GdhA4 [Candidatus Doudnabacteria bacterium]|nr:GdhA4 [Candidatus Doudnabacteria bacterium]
MSKKLKVEDYEQIVKIDRPDVGLKGFIAIHTTKPGSALGATRVYDYATEEEALQDAMRLARTMTYKCAIAKLPHGGGKAVLIGRPEVKNDAWLKAYAEEVNKLKGSFFTGEDVGMYQKDLSFLQQHSNYFIGTANKAGDSAPYAALGVFYCIQTTLNFVNGTPNLNRVTVAIKGLGKTGLELARFLTNEGAVVVGADINPAVAEHAKKFLPSIKIVPVEEINSISATIFAPCAMGDDLSEGQLGKIKAKIICGTANNQLQSPEVGDRFFEAGYICIPDYLANAGGLIDVADELEPGGYNKERVMQRISDLKKTCLEVLKTAKDQKISHYRVTNQIAEKQFTKIYA